MLGNHIESPLVTIVTVTYNSSAYVRDAIESVLAQQYANFEYIIGDDCSTDNTWEIIQSYKDSRIRAYRNETNLREYPNRNKAIALATGKYLIFIDGDDVIYPHGLEFMVRMIESFPDAAMAIMRKYHPKLIYPVEVTPHDLFVAEYFDKSLLDIAFTNTFFKTEVLREVGSLPIDYISGDTYVRLKIAKTKSCVLIGDSLTWWRMTPGQATLKAMSSILGDMQHYQCRVRMLDEDSPFTDEEKSSALKNLRYKVVHKAMRMLLKGHLKRSYQLLKTTGLLWKLPACLLYTYTTIDPFASYSAVNPKKISFEQNPYSSKKKTLNG
ncbi:MAG TPA: glycosyltransferase [Cyclobacteriaceae bacterium]